VIGAQLGSRAMAKLPAEQIRVLLALLVIGVGAGLAYQLTSTPKELFSIAVGGHGL